MTIKNSIKKGRINAFLRRRYKYGFMHYVIDIKHLLSKTFRNLEICKSVNIVSIIYSLHAEIMILNFDRGSWLSIAYL